MNDRDQENTARPDGFTDRTSDLASRHAHEQGWRIIEVGKTTTSKAKNSASESKLFARAERAAGDSAIEAGAVGTAGANPQAVEKVEKMTSPLVKRNLNRPKVIWVRNKLEKTAA
jgi:hypothetical protein